METKKITFGFTKTIKKPQLQANKKESVIKNKTELITCLEDNKIKFVDESPKTEDERLVIPLQNSSKTSKALESLRRRKAVLEGIDIEESKDNVKQISNSESINNLQLDSLEKRAITELLIEARKDFNGDPEETGSKLTLVVKPEDLPLDGAEESTLEDYGNIPINQFGMAMLRGMGLKDEVIKKKKIEDDICPRPKGMGLGADKAVKRQPMLIPPEENEKLEIKKNSFIKILAGKYKKQYGQIEGLDDRTGRVIVKLALGGLKESLCEYLLQPVSKKEYQTYGKVINSEKYEEYKRKAEIKLAQITKEENYLKEEPKIKTEKYDESYKYDTNQKYCKTEINKREGFKIKTENEDYTHNSKNNSNISNSDSKIKSVSSRRQSPNKEYSDSRRNTEFEKNQDDKIENRKTFKSYENDNNRLLDNDTPLRRRSRSTERRKKRLTSESSEDYPEKYRYKTSKSKSSKSKKHRRDKHKYKYSSSDDDKKHKKKTKKSRKSRSRSRSRNRR
ncbi:G-patch domain and KOW motifs-containing protein [Condylostylus longicornis]|uniref:G-patch domain and KOW motifs-containing protein n=1 Tax=Condylostylus longicornis TaxID=2530218 RepID=UPI00244D9BB7|nr:G-patch domain and KOW motifs-containing protein [Condylostylus longicornis]